MPRRQAHVCANGGTHSRVGAREQASGGGRLRVSGRSPEGSLTGGAKGVPRPSPSHLCGSEVKGHVKQVGLLPGPVSPQDVIRVLHGVHENHHLQRPRGRGQLPGAPGPHHQH